MIKQDLPNRYPNEILSLNDFNGFFNRYQKYYKNPKNTQAKSYEMAENDHIKFFGRRKYSNYESFRGVCLQKR